MKKIVVFVLILTLFLATTQAIELYKGIPYSPYKGISIEDLLEQQKRILTLGDNRCENYKESDIPTIFIPGILASWYSEEGYNKTSIKRWLPDPITHSYDTLFYTFKKNGYTLRDVFYEDKYNLSVSGSPKSSLYLFGYDWKKDNQITATLLAQLIGKILISYEKEEGCNIERVNIIAHSMGGLIARAMLEDMCSDYSLVGDKMIIRIDKTENGQLARIRTRNCENPYPSPSLGTEIKVNKLISISTPHRGSPSSFPLWERGNIEKIEGFFEAGGIKSQIVGANLGLYSLYQSIHGYNKKIPNGIITIGQLLPDIESYSNSYNEKLKYLYKKRKKEIKKSSYPKNKFLEKLNKKENIDKMWKKIKDKYISYYSIQTGNHKKNNIISFNLKDRVIDSAGIFTEEKTENYTGKDIYEKYSKIPYTKAYNIDKTNRNSAGLGGDGTVPTLNLLLVPNDTNNSKQIKHPKFEAREMGCYTSRIPKTITEKLLEKTGEDSYVPYLYKGLGKGGLKVCSHSKTPIGLAVRIFEDISGDKITIERGEYSPEKERKLLLSYIGHTDYIRTIKKQVYPDSFPGEGSLEGEEYTGEYKPIEINYEELIKNNSLIDRYFEDDVYKKSLTQEQIAKDNINKPISVSLDFGSKVTKLLRYDILSPINVLIEDSKGRKIGIDPESGFIINEIPGAWTSGNTENSREPEFFLIPYDSGEEINHKIRTYGTGEGGYKILLSDVSLGGSFYDPSPNPSPYRRGELGHSVDGSFSGSREGLLKPVIISGMARSNFGDDYELKIDEKKELSYKNLTNDMPAEIEIGSDEYQVEKKDFVLSYNLRGDSVRVEKIKYSLYGDEDKKLGEEILEITGKIDLVLEEIGEYSLFVNLLDGNDNKLDNPESEKGVFIERTETREVLLERKRKLEQEKESQVEKFEKNERLQKKLKKIKRFIDERFSDERKKSLRIYIGENKRRYIDSVKDRKKVFYEYVLGRLEGFLGE